METYKGMELNDIGDPQPWGVREKTNLKYLRDLIESLDNEITTLESTVADHSHYLLVKHGTANTGLQVENDYTKLLNKLIINQNTPSATLPGMIDLLRGFSDAFAVFRVNGAFGNHGIDSSYEESNVFVSLRAAVSGSSSDNGGLKLRTITKSSSSPSFVLEAIADANAENTGFLDNYPICKYVAAVKDTASAELTDVVGANKIIHAWYNHGTIVMAIMADGRLVLGDPKDGPAWGFKYSGSDFHVTHKPNAGTGWVETGFVDLNYSA